MEQRMVRIVKPTPVDKSAGSNGFASKKLQWRTQQKLRGAAGEFGLRPKHFAKVALRNRSPSAQGRKPCAEP